MNPGRLGPIPFRLGCFGLGRFGPIGVGPFVPISKVGSLGPIFRGESFRPNLFSLEKYLRNYSGKYKIHLIFTFCSYNNYNSFSEIFASFN